MPVEAECPSCEGKFRLPDAAAGKKIRCPKCKGPLDVPPLGSPPAEVAASPVAPVVPAPVKEALKESWRGAPPKPAVNEASRQEAPKPQVQPQPIVVPQLVPGATTVTPTKAIASTVVTKPKQVEFKLPEVKPEPPSPKPKERKPDERPAVETKPVVFKPGTLPPEQWFLRGEDGESYGPVDRATLNAWHAEGRMTADSQLLQQGNDQWQWASDLYPDLEESEEPVPDSSPAPSATTAPAATKPPSSSIHSDEIEPAASSRLGARSGKGSAVHGKRSTSPDRNDEELDSTERLSPHSKPVAFLLAITLGMFGIHRFYLGYVGLGLAMFFTFGGLLMWSLTDALRILFGHVTDSEGLKLRD